MQLFLRQRDLDLFNTITQTLVETIVQTPVRLYKLAISSMRSDDLYGDSLDKVYYNPVQVYGLIEHTDESIENTDAGVDSNQQITANFQREILRTANVYPEVGDIIEWLGHYYEVDNINENKIVAGQENQNFNYTIQCFAHLTRKSKMQIEEFRPGDGV